jgi:hypothetical protein
MLEAETSAHFLLRVIHRVLELILHPSAGIQVDQLYIHHGFQGNCLPIRVFKRLLTRELRSLRFMSVLLGSLEAASFPSDLIILDRVQAIFVRLFGFTIL